MGYARKVPLERFESAIAEGFAKDKTLLVIDEVGKQSQWLQYYLEKYGYSNYFFLADGADHYTQE
jgi:rhodanese-related sulfurtransferase